MQVLRLPIRLLFALLLVVAAPVNAAEPRTFVTQKQQHHSPSTTRSSRRHDLAGIPLRGGGAAAATKKKMKNVGSNNKKSPFGLPVLVGPTLYGHLDFIPFVGYFWFFNTVLQGTAKKVYATVGIFHTLHSLATDYDGKGSWFQRLLGIPIVVPKWTMYWFDILIPVVFAILPSVIDGYDEKTTMIIRCTALGGLVGFFPFCSADST